MSYHLQVPVLFHGAHKPGCRDVILHYYATLTQASPHRSSLLYQSSSSGHPFNNTPTSALPIKPSELIVVGDRLFTDVLMGNKLGALTVWTQGLWKRELLAMRFFEKSILWVLDAVEARRRRLQGTDISSSLTPQAAFVKVDTGGALSSRETPTGRLIPALKKGYDIANIVVRGAASRLSSLRTHSSPAPLLEPPTLSRFRTLPARLIHSFNDVTVSLLERGSTIAANIVRRGWLRIYNYSTERSAPLRSAISNVRNSFQGRRTD